MVLWRAIGILKKGNVVADGIPRIGSRMMAVLKLSGK